jgi:hypothetical protein
MMRSIVVSMKMKFYTVKLGYNEHAWDRPNLFVKTGIRYNRVG